MATEVQVALQAQAAQDPEAALAAAAVRLARASLATLAQQLGQTLVGKVIAAPSLPPGFTQIAAADQTLTFKLSSPLPVGTPVSIDVAAAAGERAPLVTIQPTLPRGASADALQSRSAEPVTLSQPQRSEPAQLSPAPRPTLAAPAPAAPPSSLLRDIPESPRPPASDSPAPAPSRNAAPPPPSSLALSAPVTTGAAPPVPAPTQSPPQPIPQTSPAPTTAAPSAPTSGAGTPAAPVANVAPAGQAAPAATNSATAPSTLAPSQPPPAPAAQGQLAAAPIPVVPPQGAVSDAPAMTAVAQAPPASSASAPATQQLSPSPPPAGATTGAHVQPAPAASPTAPATAPTPSTVQVPPQQALLQRLTQAFAPPAPTAASQPIPPTPSMVAATAQAAGQQQSAAPLLDALARQIPNLPPPVAEAAARVLASRLNVERGAPSAEALKSAVLRAGVLLAPPSRPGEPPDLKAALTQLRSALLGFLGQEVEPVAPVARRPPPPARGAPPRAFTPDAPMPPSTDSRDAAKSLLGQTDGALSRLRLLQMTSHGNDATRAGAAIPAPAEWNLELPLLLGRELAMAQIQISRDGKQKGDERERSWRLKFALKFSVLGEVGAQVSMVGRRASVALWADEVLTAETLEEMLPELAPALAAKGLELASLTVRRGVPRDDARPMGQLMDSRR